MYCSSCGVAAAQGLSYCNHCGAKLGAAQGDEAVKTSGVKPELLVSAMVGGFVLGLVAIAVLVGVLRAVVGFDLTILLAVTILCFMLLLAVEGVLVGLLLKGRRRSEEAGDDVRPKGQMTRGLDEARARVLPEPVPSVTEHTTRSFDPVYRERNST